MSNGLNTKQTIFVEQYLQCWNATEAARRAGYSEKYLNTNASKLLRNTTISKRIDARIAELKMSTDEILLRLADQARGDIGEFAKITNSQDLAEHPRSRIVKKYKRRVFHPENRDSYEEIEVELYDAHAPLVDLGKAKAIFTDKIEQSVKIDGKLVILPRQDD